MSKFYLVLSLLVIGFSAKAVAATSGTYERPDYRDAFIFEERGVEFAVFPDGQFDFFFNPHGNFHRVPSHINYSFNSGYNYGPFIQYDDFGAVIQIENVPVFYDYYGRIIQAGRVRIGYNAFGLVNRIGNMYLHYNHFNELTHTSGFINRRNINYAYRPWHKHYVRPYSHVVVYNEPYRLYYSPDRMDYDVYRRYYYNHYNNGSFQKSYYRPGERVTTYHRGRRDETPRKIRTDISAPRNTEFAGERNISRQSETRDVPATRQPERRTSTSRVTENTEIKRDKAPQMRTSRVENVPVQRSVETRASDERNTTPTVQRRTTSVESDSGRNRFSSREIKAQTVRTESPAEVRTAPQVRTLEPPSTRGTRSSRGN